MRQLIAGNWKMNGRLEDATAILTPLRRGADGLTCDLLVCPPATLLHIAAHALVGTPIAVGAQDCHARPKGAHTGDLAAPMLRDAGATWVILGHSERRAAHMETSSQVADKAAAAAAAGLTPIVCVGETQSERDSGQAQAVVEAQLRGSLPDGFQGVIAYEPVWAIGTGRTAAPEDVTTMHAHIRLVLGAVLGPRGATTRILYGGSVNPANALTLLALPEVGGALVGGASLSPADFLAIARSAAG